MRKFILSLVILLSFSLSACDSNNSDNGSEVGVEGVYNLKTIGGQAVPVVLAQFLEDKIEVTSGKITLRSNKTFLAELALRITESGVVDTQIESDEGTFTLSGTALQLTYDDETIDNGSLANGTMTIMSDGLSMVFRK